MHERTRDALMEGRGSTPALVIAAALSLALAGLVLVTTGQVLLAIFTLVLPSAGAVLVLRAVLGPMRLNRALARLASLPFAFDREAYLAVLAEERMSIALELVVSFASTPPDGAQALIDTMGRAGEFRDARWIDHATLHLFGPDITTSFSSGSATQQSSVETGGVHRWFSRSAIPLLGALHACSPIARVAVRS